jgi:hypothetical protein
MTRTQFKRDLGNGYDSFVQRHDSQHGGQYIGKNQEQALLGHLAAIANY